MEKELKEKKSKKSSNDKAVKNIPVVEEILSTTSEVAALYKECEEYNSPKEVKRRKMKTAGNVIGNIFFLFIMAILCYGIIITNLAKVNGKVPFVLGYSIQYVETGSMEPTLPTGCLILCEEINESTVISNDEIITFYEGYDRSGEKPQNSDRKVVTHRVYSIATDENGVIWYTTKGDNNNAPDRYPILFSDVISTFVRRIY